MPDLPPVTPPIHSATPPISPKNPHISEPRVRLSTEIEIEFGDSRNRVFAWGPTKQMLRGKWTRNNLNSDELVEELARMPDIPGMRIRIHTERKVALIYDPLALPENEETMRQVQSIIKKNWNRDEGPGKPIEMKDFDNDSMKSWLYLMRRRVNNQQAFVTAGTLPPLETINMIEGRIRIEWFNESFMACRWLEEFNEYINRILTGNKGGMPV